MSTSLPQPPGPPVIYKVDADDRLCDINPTFLDFAHDNEMRMDQSHLLGMSLWSFIADPQTVALYRSLLSQVRDENRRVHFAYRCDSPDLKRFMHMVVTPFEDGAVSFENRIQRVEPQNPKLVFDARRIGRHKPLRVCSICRSVERSDGDWISVSDAFAKGMITENEHRVAVIYKVCPACERRVIGQGRQRYG